MPDHTVKWEWRDTGEPFEAVLVEHEYEWFRSQWLKVKDMPRGPERTAILMETATFMELKGQFPGSEMLTAEEQAAALPSSVGALEARGFSIPQAAKDQMLLGQLPLGEDG